MIVIYGVLNFLLGISWTNLKQNKIWSLKKLQRLYINKG